MTGIGRGDIEARLNDRRTQEQIKVALQKLHHDSFQRPLGHLPMGYADATLGHEPLQQRLHRREVSIRLCTKNTCPPRVSSSRMARSMVSSA